MRVVTECVTSTTETTFRVAPIKMNEFGRSALFVLALVSHALCVGGIDARESASPVGLTSGEPTSSVGRTSGEPTFESIGASQGNSGTIYSIFVDSFGFVWFVSDHGVHRYDGQNVYTFDRDPDQHEPLGSQWIARIAQTADAMWILSFPGALRRLDSISGKLETFVLEHNKDLAGRGTRLVADRAGSLWIGTDLGLFRFDTKRRAADFINLGDGQQTRITALTLSADGERLFAGCVDGRIFALDVANPSQVELLASIGQAVPLTMAPAKDALWLGTVQGLLRYDFGARNFGQAGVPAELTHGRVDAVAVAEDGALWVGGAHHVGLTRFNPATGESAVYRHRPDDQYSLSSDRVSALEIDDRGNLWVGLQRDGAARINIAQHGATRYGAPDGHDNNFCAESEMPDGRILVVLCGGSVGVFDPRTGMIEGRAAEIDSVLPFAQPTLSGHAIIADRHEGYWLATENAGLLYWRPNQHEAKRFPLLSADGNILPDPYMNAASLDGNGRLWVGCSLGLAMLAPGQSALHMTDVDGPIGRSLTSGVLSVSVANDGTLWLGTTQGLVHFDPTSHRTQQYGNATHDPHSLSDNLVVTTHIDADGSLWVGTEAGLNHASIQGDILRMRRYSLADGLPDRAINAIVHDAKGTLWVGTNRGIAQLDTEHDRFIALGTGDGVPKTAINRHAGLTGGDGSVYFGSSSGLIRIFPEQLQIAKPQPIMLSSYEVGPTSRINLRGSELEGFTTEYTEARVRFNVTAFGDRRSMSYRLAGLDARWKEMPQDLSVSYDPLPSGSYRFEVRHTNEELASLSVPLTVLPPPWRTPLAYLFYVATSFATLLMLVFVYRQRRANELRHIEELHRVERQALDARLRLLQAQVAPHFLFNTLANVRALVKARSPQADAILSNLIDYLRAAVPRLNENATTVGQELQLVQAYLELMRTRIPDRLQFALNVDESTYPIRCPPLTLLTLVENAVRHGIDPSVDGGRIDVEVQRQDDRCILRVSDTGVGMDNSNNGMGTGLSALRERLQLFFRGKADLRLSPLAPHGARAEIEIPARTEE